jgi:hypothetical protein
MPFLTPSTGVTSTLDGTGHPDIEIIRTGGQHVIRGAAGVRAWMEPDAFESMVIEPLEFRVVEDKVLVHGRAKVKGAGSGIETETLIWEVWTFNKAGLVTRVEIYSDHDEADALQAAGLRE